MELRCPHRKFGEVTVASLNQAEIEVACPSRWCGKRTGIIVVHVFCLKSGELLSTRQFRSPEGGKNGTRQ
jgi:hypothetical protein